MANAAALHSPLDLSVLEEDGSFRLDIGMCPGNPLEQAAAFKEDPRAWSSKFVVQPQEGGPCRHFSIQVCCSCLRCSDSSHTHLQLMDCRALVGSSSQAVRLCAGYAWILHSIAPALHRNLLQAADAEVV